MSRTDTDLTRVSSFDAYEFMRLNNVNTYSISLIEKKKKKKERKAYTCIRARVRTRVPLKTRQNFSSHH